LVRNTNYLEFGSDDVFLQLASLSFDASTFEIWGPLLNGGRLALAPPNRLSLAELSGVISHHKVTTLWLTAGLFHQLVEDNPSALSNIRNLLAGGDILSPKHVREALRHLPRTRLINGYGPTENTTFTCCFPMTADAPPPDGPIPIGTPIANTRVYILDVHRHPVPIGVTGELYTGGDGLARGYLNHPELTAEKFIPDPFSDNSRARLYKTADLARYMPNGSIEFLGRLDHQVKIRGFRIEPGEVEAVLRKHPAVRAAVVVARKDETGDKSLVAYYAAPSRWHAPPTSELRAFVKSKLPEQMVPSVFVLLETLPLTTNGKVDRKALPAPEGEQRSNLEVAFVAPRNELEELLADIWSEVLGEPLVGIQDNFFELGGHSLLGTQVISRLRNTLQVTLSLRDIFEAPTVALLAQLLTRINNADEPATSSRLSIESFGNLDELGL
jgi:aspartate racemase